MPRTFNTLARFDKGLVTDRSSVPGALLEARDVIPLPNMNGWRVRGGKGDTAAVAGSTGGLEALSAGTGLAVNRGVVFGLLHGSTATGVASWPALIDGPGVQLPVGVTGGSLAGRTNEFELEGCRALFGEEMWVPSLEGIPLRWAGANGGTEITTGTVSGSAASRTLTFSSGVVTTAHVGWYVWIGDAALDARAYRIVSRESSTSVTLDRPLPAAATAETYLLSPVSWWSVAPGTFGGGVAGGTLSAVSDAGYVNARCATQHQGRVGVANLVDNNPLKHFPDRYRWSAVEQETDALYGGDGEYGGAEYFHPNAYVDVAPGKGGVGIYAVESYDNNVYWFKRGGVFVGRGYVETDGRDVGFTVDTVTLEDGLLAGTMPVVTDTGIVFCGERGIYRVDGQGIENLATRGGVRLAYDKLNTTGAVENVSWSGRRLIVQNDLTRAEAVEEDVPNTLVWYPDEGVWSQQQTIRTTAIIDAGDAQLALAHADEAAGTLGEVVFWDRDEAEPALPGWVWGVSLWGVAVWGSAASGSQVYDGVEAAPVLLAVTTHVFPLRGEMNGRMRGAQLLAKLVDDQDNDPEIALTVLLGEQGDTEAVEAGIVGTDFVETAAQTEKWHRMRIDGAPPVSSARVRLRQTLPAQDVRLYEVGVEHVAVARFR